MAKIVIIESCEECPNFYNMYYTWEEKCIPLDRVIKSVPTGMVMEYFIPDDCPLEDAPVDPEE